MDVEQIWCEELNCPHCDKDCDYTHKKVCERYVALLSQQNLGSHPVVSQTSDALLKIMNKCIQRGTDSRTVGHYVITSGEMSRMSDGEEIHILSNEYMNYDYTPVSSLAIALNTKKGIHYYYYGTKEQETVILSLKERVKSYYQKGLKAKDKIARWVRKAKSSLYNYQDFLRSLCGYSIGNIVKSVIIGSNIAEVEKEGIIDVILDDIKTKNGKEATYEMPNLANLKIVLDWIDGVGKTQNDEDVYRFIDELGILIYSIKDDENLMRDIFIKDFCDKIQLLLDMKEFAIWQTKNGYKINPDRIDYLLRVFQYKDNNAMSDKFNELISAPMREWLKSAKDETDGGMVYCEESEMNSWADNIHFCVLNDENPYTLCYSFTLFLGEEGQAAAWYTTYKDNTNGDDSALDNQLLMIDILRGDPLLGEIEEAFKTIIISDDSVKAILNNSNSRIIKLLGI